MAMIASASHVTIRRLPPLGTEPVPVKMRQPIKTADEVLAPFISMAIFCFPAFIFACSSPSLFAVSISVAHVSDTHLPKTTDVRPQAALREMFVDVAMHDVFAVNFCMCMRPMVKPAKSASTREAQESSFASQ